MQLILLPLRRALTSLLAILAVVAMVLPATASAERFLRYSDHEPLGGMRTRFLKDVFFAAVEKESKGRLKIQDHWNGQLAGAYDALRAAGQGEVTDLSLVVPEYTARELPLHQLFKSFPVGPAGQSQVDFFRRVYAEVPAFTEELARNQVVPVFLATGYPVAFYGTKPLSSLQDVQGTKWRTASFWHRDFLRQAGATPVTLPWGPAVYTALEDRSLDGLMVNVDSGHHLKVHQTAPHVLLSRDLWLGHLYIVAMNRNTWNGLAPEDRQAVQRAAQTAYQSLGQVMDSSLDAMEATLRQEGASVRQLDKQEVVAWSEATRYTAVQDAWVREQKDKGVSGLDQALHTLRRMVADAL